LWAGNCGRETVYTGDWRQVDWQLVTATGSNWQLLAASGSYWQQLAATGSFLWLLAINGSYWQCPVEVVAYSEFLAATDET